MTHRAAIRRRLARWHRRLPDLDLVLASRTHRRVLRRAIARRSDRRLAETLDELGLLAERSKTSNST